jgi:hypothetical protein
VTAGRCIAGTPDCPATHADRPVNYSRRRLKNPRAASWPDRAPDCPMNGTGPSGAVQSSTFSLFLFLVYFCSLLDLSLCSSWHLNK